MSARKLKRTAGPVVKKTTLNQVRDEMRDAARGRGSLYFEAHVTIDPPETEFDLGLVTTIASRNDFRLAKLLMRKDGSPHKDDAFMTLSATNLERVKEQTVNLVTQLRQEHFEVRRYKIEETIIDSRNWDTLKIL